MELKRQLASQEEACRNPEHANSPPSNSNSSLASEAAEPQQSESLSSGLMPITCPMLTTTPS